MAFGNQIMHARVTASESTNNVKLELAKTKGDLNSAKEDLNSTKEDLNSANEARNIANSEANKAYDIAVAATKELAKKTHLVAQNKHLVAVEQVVNAYKSCKDTNEFNQKVNDLTGAPLIVEDCLKICTDFNSLTATYNVNNGFAGEMAFTQNLFRKNINFETV